MAKALFTRNGKVVFTMDYNHVRLFWSRKVKQATTGVITEVHSGLFFNTVTHVDIRLADGTFLRNVPVKFLAV